MSMLLDIHEPGQTPMPHEEVVAIGIDFGTTNSVVAICDNGECQAIRDEQERSLLPSVVAYKEDGSVVTGSKAQSMDGEAAVIRSVKRLMGKGAGDIKTVANIVPFPIAPDAGNGMVTLDIYGNKITPMEVSAEILKALKARAEKALEKDVGKAVITVPAYFDDAARAATKDAARLAGLEVLRLINEPTAAALAYGLDNGSEGIYAVYDLGGGTFDVSLLKMQKGVFQVLATGGDTALGGDDFDHAIAEHFLTQSGKKADEKNIHGLLALAREAREYLTEHEQGAWQDYTLDRAELYRLTDALAERTVAICASVMENAGLAPDDIKGIVLVGGATRMPRIREKVEQFFGYPPLTDVDPDKVVAIGAAIQAEALTRGSGTLLLDVTPLSLGLETMGGIVEKIIERNTPIPVAKSQKFTTYQDGQAGMKIHVLQGEREMVDQCRSLAQFELKGIPPMAAGLAQIEVMFIVDTDGLLTVSATELATGAEQSIEVKPSYGLQEGEIERMLEESYTHAREDITLKLLTESRVEAEQAIYTVERAIQEDADLLDKNLRKKIVSRIAALREMMETSDRDAIDYEVQLLENTYTPFAEARVSRALNKELDGKSVDAVEQEMASK